MTRFWSSVNKVLRSSDILLHVLDSRLPEESLNNEISDKASDAGIPVIYVLSKSDIASKEKVDSAMKKLIPSVAISAKDKTGTARLRERIMIEAKKADIKGEIKVGVVGYPNVGKSSVINALSGKHSARSSSLSGHTRGVQNVRATGKIIMIDSPGVIPYLEKDELKHAMIGTKDYNSIKDPDIVVMRMLGLFPSAIESYFEIERSDDPEETIERIAKKQNLLAPGAKPDITRCSRMILKIWQEGKIRT